MTVTCPRCGRTSANPNDVREGYCGACRTWTQLNLTTDEAAGRLRMAAAGREEYAKRMEGSDDPSLIKQRETLLLQATTLRHAADVVEGDFGPLYSWLPSWRWTART